MKQFLKTLRNADINVKVVEGELKLTAKKGALTNEILQELKARKAELIAYLNVQESQAGFNSIPAAEAQEGYLLSPSQYRLWVLSQFDDALVAYNMPAAKLLEGPLDTACFEQALNALVERHEILRTVFRQQAGTDEVRQYVLSPEAAGFRVEHLDLQNQPDAEAQAKAYVAHEALRPFDLSAGPMFRAALLRLDAERVVFFFNIHHIISDGWSMKVLTNELLTFYNQFQQALPPAAAPLRIHYKDFAAWQHEQLQAQGLQSHQAYWLEQLKGELPVLELQYELPRPAVKTYNGEMVQFRLSKDIQAGLKQLNETYGGTSFMGIMAALNTLFYRYTGQEDIVIGSPIAGREHADLENQIGFYINTLALRTQFSGQDSFSQLYEQVKRNTLGAYKHQLYPFDQLVDDLGVKRDVSRSPLFDVMVVMQNTDLQFGDQEASAQTFADLRITPWQMEGRLVSKYDMTLAFTEGANGISMAVQYNTDLFTPAYIQRFFAHFARLLERIISAPNAPLHSFDFLSEEEVYRQKHTYNANHLSIPQSATLHELFTERAATLLLERAVVFENRSLTYKEVDELSNKLAGYLLATYDIQPNDRVGVMLERNEWYVVTVLAILKAGGAFVPIDLAYPEERIAYMQRNSELTVLLNAAELATFTAQKDNYPALAPQTNVKAQDLAYVIYTSGSTGEPKGVMIEHQAIVNTVLTEIHSLEMKPGIRGMQFLSSSFDVSVWEIFTILLSGGELHIASDALKKDATGYTSYLNEHRIEIAAMPPVYLQLLDIEQLQHLKQLVTGGEEANLELIRAFCQHGDYINAYGPTEASVVATTHIVKKGSVPAGSKIPIGKPIGNMEVYLLDPNGNLLPEGMIGALYIGGPGLSRGYLNRPELTAERFVAHPFKPAAKLYHTGDMARWLPDGTLAFAGRQDDQVKIRGHRIELREIENVLLTFPTVREAVVIAREMSDQPKELVTYFVSSKIEIGQELKAHLAKHLPAYMVPDYYVQLESIPVTANGKINKQALPDPDYQKLSREAAYVAPRNKAEEVLVEVWKDVLKKERVGAKDNFFELGGDSIKSIMVISRIKEKGYSLKVSQVLTYPLLEDLAQKLTKLAGELEIGQDRVEGAVPLTPIQKWFLERDKDDKNHFNQPVLLYSKAPIDEAALQACLEKLVDHHDALRMTFTEQDGFWTQHNQGQVPLRVQVADLRGTENELGAFAQEAEKLQTSINLANGPLIQLGLFRLSDGDRLLMLVHHLVTDGVSTRILLEDLSTLYNQYTKNEALKLPLKTVSYKYWAEQQLAYAGSAKLQKEAKYWKQAVNEDYQTLPLDMPAGSNTLADTTDVTINLSQHYTELLLTRCHRAYSTETNDLLLAAFSRAVDEVFAIDKLLVKLEGHGREQLDNELDISRTVGWFTTMYPVKLEAAGNRDLIRHVVSVKETLRKIPNKGIGYGILKYLGTDASFGMSAEPQVKFNYKGDFGSGVESKGGERVFEFSNESKGQNMSPAFKRDSILDFSGIVMNNSLKLSIIYSRHQFFRETIEALSEALNKHLLLLIDELSGQDTKKLTPSDLSYSDLSLDDFDALNKAEDVEDIYPLSPLQQGIYYHWLVQPESKAYVVQTSYRFSGSFEVALLQKSYELLVGRHAILRTSFTADYGHIPLQIVRANVKPSFYYEDISGLEMEEVEAYLAGYEEKDRTDGFDLHQGSQVRLSVIKLAPQHYAFVWSTHHILMDGWCVDKITAEFYELYSCLLAGQPVPQTPTTPYANFIRWIGEIDKQDSVRFWENYLADYQTPATLPFAAKVPKGTAYELKEGLLKLDESQTVAIDQLCKKLNSTTSNFFQSAWGTLLSFYNNTTDVVFGSVVSGRPADLDGVEDIIGLFINTIPTRIRYTADTTVRELLQEVQSHAIGSEAHHYVQLADIQARTGLNGDLFNHLMVNQNRPAQKNAAPAAAQAAQAEPDTVLLGSKAVDQTNYDLNIIVKSNPDSTRVWFKYNSAVYSEEAIERLKEHFQRVINAFVVEPDRKVAQLTYISSREQAQLLTDFNQTEVDYGLEKTVVELFQEQVAHTPDSPAVVHGATTLSYRQLDEISTQLAHYLLEQHRVQANDFVGIQLYRSEWLVLAVLATLKVGAAYVPIDPEYPQERIGFIRQDSNSRLVLDAAELDRFRVLQAGYATQWNNGAIAQPTDLAYAIYTSGTTGRPKGVPIQHRSLSNYVSYAAQTYAALPGTRQAPVFPLFTSFSFDLTVTSIFAPLVTGGSIVVYGQEGLDEVLSDIFWGDQAISVVKCTPIHVGLLSELGRRSTAVRKVIVGGEQLKEKHVAYLLSINPDIEIYNEYGPTETTVGATVARIDRYAPEITIGKPISNTEIVVLDAQQRLVPVGVVGELYIGGRQLARGYWNRPALSQEKFVAHPYQAGARLYRTGDLGRWLPDGSLDYLGRIDHQVKIRGYRVETEEIERVLLTHPSLTEAVVLASPNAKGEAELVAYLVVNDSVELDEMRGYLESKLPAYMVPSYFVELPQLPLTINGKLDRLALPDPRLSSLGSSVAYEAPRSYTEEQLALIWQEVLGGTRQIGVHDNFFSLGGHSIKLFEVVLLIKRDFEVKLDVSTAFSYLTIESLAREIDRRLWESQEIESEYEGKVEKITI
ncbi:amino acid adenylation domain-containing protein [Hymenobacter sp. BT635]|uniref:Amino acid adenylation domain-containing protein n=2 Tax=Hymenobacter nitidus TaxID=2880929 RepID=A0ABS8A860_9BACT|nr:amino acid adenylation domain-containing protein [Hymenobacter nitidus]